MRLHDTLLGLLLMALAAAFFGYTFTFPAFPGQRYGPALFPQVISAGIFICGGIIAARGWRSGAPWLRIDAALRDPRRLASFLAIPLAIVFYLMAAERLGFLPTAALIVGLLAWWFGVRPLTALLLGVVASGVIHWFFASLMRVPLPRGWFMQLLVGG
jgi:putative tricarboxylic transport membrane protein